MSKKDLTDACDASVTLRNPHALYCDDISLTHQSFKDECDISNIMNRYQKTGLVAHMTKANALYGDFSDVPDYQAALNIVIEAEEAFMELPAQVRLKFDNDPGKFLEFVHNPDNRAEMVEMGMIIPPKEDAVNINTVEAA